MKCINSSIVKNTLLILSCMSTTVCLAMMTDKEKATMLFQYINIAKANGFKDIVEAGISNVQELRNEYGNNLFFNKNNNREDSVYVIRGNELVGYDCTMNKKDNTLAINSTRIQDTPINFNDPKLNHFVDQNSIYTKERSKLNKFGPMAAVVYLEASLPGNNATTLTGTVAHSAIFSTARTIAIKHSLLNYAPDKMDVLQGGIVAALATAAGVFDRSQCAQQLIKNIEASKVGQATIAKLNPRIKNLLISSGKLVRNAGIYLIVDAAMKKCGFDVALKDYKAHTDSQAFSERFGSNSLTK